ncbi:hypothetical protein MA9V1_148 [Chryseobacterium phage MA9V-1]|nr:hypothetical protein MA9V1_148 [Chryseobacterium phage MA9V-1]
MAKEGRTLSLANVITFITLSITNVKQHFA